MAKKRKAPKSFEKPPAPKSTKFDAEERFDDSEDEFFAGKDKILLDESAQTKRRQRLADQEKDLQLSDEEVLGYQEDDYVSEDDDGVDINEDDDASLVNGRSGGVPLDDEDDESEDEVWGTNRADYYGDDVIETEEQAREEEKEAKRLYQKQLKNMTEADFGFDEDMFLTEQKDQKKTRSAAEKLPEAQVPENATREQKLQILEARYPELLPLAEDFYGLQELKTELDGAAEVVATGLKAGAVLGHGISVTIKRDALNAYLATISLYFAVVASNASQDSSSRKITAMSPLDLHEHSVVQSLARARQLWDQVKDLETVPLMESPPTSPTSLRQAVEASQRSDLIKEKLKSKKKSKKADRALDFSGDAFSDFDEPKKGSKKSKAKEKKKLLDINSLMAQTEAVGGDTSGSDFGDETPLTEEQYAEKAKKRKSLRFYTSQLASKANKRGQASRVAGGDDDLPYKERQRDKRERLLREAENRGRGKADAADDFGGDDDYDHLPNRRDTNDEYYDALLNAKNAKQSDKQARAEAYAQAAKEGATVYEEETVGADGKRAITYAIAKNKGLAPKRNKDVRNPRVKKRKKYDEKMKKLASMKAVYKGGEGRGGYGGELSGIKTNVVKSVKL